MAGREGGQEVGESGGILSNTPRACHSCRHPSDGPASGQLSGPASGQIEAGRQGEGGAGGQAAGDPADGVNLTALALGLPECVICMDGDKTHLVRAPHSPP